MSNDLRRLRVIALLDVATAALGITVMLLTFAFVERSSWLLVLCGIVGASGLLMLCSLLPLRRGDGEGAVQWLAAANWSVAIAASTIATFAWPMMLVAGLLPAVLAAPYVPAQRLRLYLVVSMSVAVVVTVLGLVQDVSGFTDDLPTWVPPAVSIMFTPFLATLMVLVALQHSTRLQAALDEAIRSRKRLVAATDRERRRVERDLHDGAQARLVALGVRLRLAENQCAHDPAGAAGALRALRAEVHEVQQELRELAHGVFPAVLAQKGLGPAIEGAADRCPLKVTLELGTLGRFPGEVEAAVYFCCVEGLQNAAKHAGEDASVVVRVMSGPGELRFAVADDGRGFAPGSVTTEDGSGLSNLRDRLGAIGGRLSIESGVGAGTTIAGSVPLR